VIGTYGYMAPEQFRGAAQPASDLYALGGTLLFLLSGTPLADFTHVALAVLDMMFGFHALRLRWPSMLVCNALGIA
jgi:serine/threonine protein kinase